MRSTDISPAPSDEEAAAITAAIEALWPTAQPVEFTPRNASVAWRFSGRWWQRDRFAPAERPWN